MIRKDWKSPWYWLCVVFICVWGVFFALGSGLSARPIRHKHLVYAPGIACAHSCSFLREKARPAYSGWQSSDSDYRRLSHLHFFTPLCQQELSQY